jgi:hypothetical protein
VSPSVALAFPVTLHVVPSAFIVTARMGASRLECSRPLIASFFASRMMKGIMTVESVSLCEAVLVVVTVVAPVGALVGFAMFPVQHLPVRLS